MQTQDRQIQDRQFDASPGFKGQYLLRKPRAQEFAQILKALRKNFFTLLWTSCLCMPALAQNNAAINLDFGLFNVPTGKERRFKLPKVSWIVRNEPATYCGKIKDKTGFSSGPRSCVWWGGQPERCELVTLAETSHSELGHLFLKCIHSNE